MQLCWAWKDHFHMTWKWPHRWLITKKWQICCWTKTILRELNPTFYESNYDFCYIETTWLLVTWINLKPSTWFKFVSVVIRIGPSMLVIKQKLMPVWALLLRVHDRILASGRHSRNREKIGKTRNDALLNIEVSSALHKNWYHWEQIKRWALLLSYLCHYSF